MKELGLFNHEITSEGGIKLFNWLKMKKSKITKLLMSYNDLNDECIQSLGEYIQDNQYLETIELSDNQLTGKGVEMLAPYLHGNTTLNILNLHSNRDMRNLSAPLLIKMIESSHLCYINLSYTSFYQKEMIALPLAQNTFRYELPNLMLNNM